MIKLRLLIVSLLIACFGFMAVDAVAEQDVESKTATQKAYVLEVRGPITPAVTDYIHQTLKLATQRDADMAVIQMHTPGGLVTAMQDIIQEILASKIPVVTYVSPSGSHAASAGTYILYASHIAAMAPATNLGAATPVSMSGRQKKRSPLPNFKNEDQDPSATQDTKPTQDDATAIEVKSMNDAVAYIRGLAELRGRNADWAEKAVRDAVSLTATEAKKKNVIDIVAQDMDDLMSQIDGRTVEVNGEKHVIQSSDMSLIEAKPNWRTRILMIITDPNVAFFFMTIGFYGLIYEFANPGALVPGIAGVICLCIGLFALNVLPVNYAGVVLLLFGIGLMAAEAFVPSFGILGIAGAIAFALGGTILIDTDILGYGVSWEIIALTTGLSVLVMIVLMGLVVKAHKRKITTGEEAMIGSEATIKDWSKTKGTILTWSEDWSAFSEEELSLKKGDTVYVIEKKGLKLKISTEQPEEEEEI